MANTSAAYVLLILAVTYLVANFMITLVNPFWSGVESSALFTFTTTWGQDLATWLTTIRTTLGLISLIAILYSGFILTREPA